MQRKIMKGVIYIEEINNLRGGETYIIKSESKKEVDTKRINSKLITCKVPIVKVINAKKGE